MRWHGQRVSPGYSSDPADNWFDPAKSPLVDYLGQDGKIKKCPSFADYVKSTGAFESGTGGYGYNQQYIGGRNDLFGFGPEASAMSACKTDIARPAETVMFTDAAFIQESPDRIIEYSFCEPPYWQFSEGAPSAQRPNPSIHFRHLDLCNVAWADAHVESRPLSFSARYKTHGQLDAETVKAAGFGWFGPDSNELFDLK